MRTLLVAICFSFLAAAGLRAAVVLFDLNGNAGIGLLSGNENGAISGSPGSGGEVGAGISYDTDTNILTINVGWGTGNGFTNLTGNATGMHIHGPTTNPAPVGFTQNAGIAVGLDSLGGYSNSATNGGFIGTVSLSAAQETQLLNQQLYINVHTATNSGGEIRGHLVIVPEPSKSLLSCMGLALLVLRRRR